MCLQWTALLHVQQKQRFLRFPLRFLWCGPIVLEKNGVLLFGWLCAQLSSVPSCWLISLPCWAGRVHSAQHRSTDWGVDSQWDWALAPISHYRQSLDSKLKLKTLLNAALQCFDDTQLVFMRSTQQSFDVWMMMTKYDMQCVCIHNTDTSVVWILEEQVHLVIAVKSEKHYFSVWNKYLLCVSNTNSIILFCQLTKCKTGLGNLCKKHFLLYWLKLSLHPDIN